MDCSTLIPNNQVAQNFPLEFLPLEDKGITILRDSRTTHSMTQCYIIEELNPPIYRSENLKPCVAGSVTNIIWPLQLKAKQARKCAHNVTLRRIRIFACGTSLRFSYRLTQYGHTFCCSECALAPYTQCTKTLTKKQRSDTECWPRGCAVCVRYHCDTDGTKFRSAFFIVTHPVDIHCGSNDST
jgi:hypothetical protein